MDAAVASPVTDLLGNVVENVLDNLEIVSEFLNSKKHRLKHTLNWRIFLKNIPGFGVNLVVGYFVDLLESLLGLEGVDAMTVST